VYTIPPRRRLLLFLMKLRPAHYLGTQGTFKGALCDLKRCSVCLSNSKQLSHNQTVLMTSHYFNFGAVTHSIKDVSVSTDQSLASSEMFRIHG